jgi:hypothetical protein
MEISIEVDPLLAAGLGFPKLRYVFVEHERRWLCKSVPVERVSDADEILDVYVTGSNLRLRDARSVSAVRRCSDFLVRWMSTHALASSVRSMPAARIPVLPISPKLWVTSAYEVLKYGGVR